MSQLGENCKRTSQQTQHHRFASGAAVLLRALRAGPGPAGALPFWGEASDTAAAGCAQKKFGS